MPTQNDGEDEITQALKPFGWTCGKEFWDRYYNDPWIFHLTNAIVELTKELNKYENTN